MFGYVLKRLIWFIPTLFFVTLISFFLLANSPGDPTEVFIQYSISGKVGTTNYESQRNYWRNELGLNLPLFYFSISKLSEPDTLYKIHQPQELKAYKALLFKTGNAETINAYYKALQYCKTSFHDAIKTYKAIDSLKRLNIQEFEKPIQAITISLNALYYESDFLVQNKHLNQIKTYNNQLPHRLSAIFDPLYIASKNLQSHQTTYKNYIPKFVWYGTNNRYHQWLFGNKHSKGILKGDFGISYKQKEPVLFILKQKMLWSIGFAVASIILAYLISIPIGIRIAEKSNYFWSKASQTIFFAIYAMPPFFVGIMLLMLFANPDFLSIFPPSGVKPIGGYSNETSLISTFFESLPYCILPLICYTYSSLAFITKLTTTSINEQLNSDYIKTAKAKGLSNKQAIRKHALKNSLLPLISVFSSLFPGLIGGSIIIENIFTIPGMGLETLKAITSHDYPIVIAVVTLSALVTICSYLIADILYAWIDPRIQLDNTHKK